MILEAETDLDVVGEAANGREAVAEAGRLRPDVVLMDVRMPGLDGIEAARRIVALAGPPIRVLMLTTFDLQEYVFNALQAGASGFLLKDVPPAELVVSETTVKTHVAHVLMKLGLRDRVQAVVLAYEAGIAVPGRSAAGPG
jgi:DNA-binding NarL/FixJ family response regulator